MEKLREYFGCKQEVIMAFLFGSSAKSRMTSQSDFDIAVWLREGYSIEEINSTWRDLESILKRNVDLIVLNQARPSIAWAAMRGKKILVRDFRFFINKMLEVSAEAEDFREFTLDFWRLRNKYKGTFK
ncbi:MAG: nucleotidyltransferase domain-containing protein [Candidatus Margulisiibacteriota bacterium]